MKLILIVILLPLLVVGAVVLFTPWLDGLIVDNIPRPQDPVERNYVIREVKFDGGETGVTLAGELTMPNSEGPFPAIVMITGSGPQDRNEQIMGHKPFLVFSDYMTKRGYAVLRYDDRGFAESTGNHNTATTEDFANDAVAALRWLKSQDNIDPLKTGFAGHSEGGYIAPLAAEQEIVNFMILLMEPAQTLAATLVEQQVDIAQVVGKSDADIARIKALIEATLGQVRISASPDEIRNRITPMLNENIDIVYEGNIEVALDIFASEWMMWLLDRDPIPALTSFTGPVLAIYGGMDAQVSAETNAPIMKATLTHTHSEVVVSPEINHFFQPVKTGALDELIWSDTTFDERLLDTIGDWLDATVTAENEQ